MRKKDPELMKKILEYVTEYYLNYSSTPSKTQIANEVGIARGTAYKYLVAMDERGMLTYQDGDIVTASWRKSKLIVRKFLRLVRLPVENQRWKKRIYYSRHLFLRQCLGKALFIFCMRRAILWWMQELKKETFL